MAARFYLGRVVATPGALERFGPARIAALLDRHASGDWGDLSSLDRRENERALKRGERIFSAYETSAGRCWIVTERDRSATTVMLTELLKRAVPPWRTSLAGTGAKTIGRDACR